MNMLGSENNGQSSEELVKKWFSNEGQHSNLGVSEPLSGGLASLLEIMRSNRWVIIGFMLVGIIAGSVKAVTEKPIYQAGLTMAVEPSFMRTNQQSMFDPFAFRFYETQYELLKSRSVAERVVDELGLVDRTSVQDLLIAPSLVKTLAYEFTKLTGIKLIQDSEPAAATLKLNKDERARKKKWLTAIIQGGVQVSGGEKTNLVQVTFRSTGPEFAAEIANALVDAYIEQGLDSQLNRTEQNSQWLSQRIVGLKQTLDAAELKLQNYLVSEDMLESSRSNQITTSELQALNSEYLEARAKLDELNKRYGARHPLIREAQGEFNAAKARLDGKSRSISSSRVKQIELDRLERDVAANLELYNAFLSKFKEADISSSGTQVTSARIIDKALPPGGPIYPQKQKIILQWTLGGLLLGIMLAFVREQLDTTFKSGRGIEAKLGLPLFGIMQTLDHKVTSVERHYLENKRSLFAESLNHIRTGVNYSNVDHPPKVILITSSVQSEGKTTVASNLALAYAQLGKTLLIDADLRRPRIKHIVKSEHKLGLVDYVAGVCELNDCLNLDKEETNLHILNSGTTPPNPLELLASDRFRSILESLREQYTYIVVDTAPVLPASDAVVLGQYCDALLMVVQSDRTTHHMVRDSIKRLASSKVGVTGIILTQAKEMKGGLYRYGGYYGYGEYAYQEDKVQE